MNRAAWAAAMAAAVLGFAGSARAAPDMPPTTKSKARPALSVARIVSSMQEGQPWGEVRIGLICVPRLHLNWGVGEGKINARAFEPPARTELKKEGFPVAGDPTDPFAQDKPADLAIGGTITAIHGDFCIAGNYLDPTAVKGSASIEVDWQLYSNIERKVISKMHTVGTAETTVSKQGGFPTILIEALDDSLSKFTSSEGFEKLADTTAQPSAEPSPAADSKSALVLVGALAAKPVKISDAVGAVVLIQSGEGHGSGFLVSSDGYVMTAQHVVGADKHVKIRWSDGLERDGEVIRTDKRRDVALIKTDSRGRLPLALRREAPQPGDTVFAIGAPLDPKFQSTVTRGVASANRIMDGFSFIQSDVTISPGNSGGPLLDEQGQVLGICDLTFRPGGGDVPTGINYFVPIRDALDFLSAEQR